MLGERFRARLWPEHGRRERWNWARGKRLKRACTVVLGLMHGCSLSTDESMAWKLKSERDKDLRAHSYSVLHVLRPKWLVAQEEGWKNGCR